MQDMNDSLDALRKSVKTRVPKLGDDILLEGITRSPRTRILSRPLFLSGVTFACVLAIGLTIALEAPTTHAQKGPLFTLATGEVNGLSYSNTKSGESPKEFGTMLPSIQFQYVPGDDLSWSGGTEKVYELKPKGNPIQLLRSLASRFGIKGEIQQDPYRQNDIDHYFFGEKDRQDLPGVDVYWQGSGSWSVNLYSAEAGKGDGYLSDDAYKALAQELFSATGLNIQLDDLALYKDNGRRVVGHLTVDGQTTPLTWEMDWDEYGNLVYATGNSVEVIDRGSVQTVSEREAVNRISDWRYQGYAGGVARYGFLAEELDSNQSTSTREIKTVKVLKAESKLVQLYDQAGDAWLVPGFTFELDQYRWTPTVFSVVDGLIELPKSSRFGPY